MTGLGGDAATRGSDQRDPALVPSLGLPSVASRQATSVLVTAARFHRSKPLSEVDVVDTLRELVECPTLF